MPAIDIRQLAPAAGRGTARADQVSRSDLAGRRILVVEDEFLIADEIAVAFARLGIFTVGPARTLEHALKLLESSGHLDGAVLDVNMRGAMVFPLADVLLARIVPFIFATGYDPEVISERYSHVPSVREAIEL